MSEMHEKDIIYIDTEDDITTVISKVKASKSKIIALVPPKRIGILQSAVNLRLLQKAAKVGEKKIAIITNNKALSSLAAAAKIPVAKNLQAEPELAEIAALEIDDGDDVIDGSEIPIGDLFKITDNSSDRADKGISRDLKDLDIDDDQSERFNSSQIYAPKDDSAKKDKKNKVKVPNSSQFRKKLILGVLGGVVLVGFLVWAIIFAPAATVIISAKTDDAPVDLSLTLASSTDKDSNTIKAITKTATKSVSVTVTPTGTKDVGTAATGTLTLTNADSSDSLTIAAGTTFTRNGCSFTTNNSVTVPGAGVKNGSIVSGTVNVGITAAEVGSDYNLSAGDYVSPIDGIDATGTATTGGDSHTAKIVTDSDITTAKSSLDSQYKSEMKSYLKNEFVNNEVILGDSFKIDYGSLTSSPAVGEEVTSTAKLTGTVTYSLTAVSKSDLGSYLKQSIKGQMNTSSQQIYDDGIDNVSIVNYSGDNSSATFNVTTTGQIGPKIDEDAIKDTVKGMGYGDAQAAVKKIDGVSDVDIKFSFFWINKIPNDTSKITIKYTVEK